MLRNAGSLPDAHAPSERERGVSGLLVRNRADRIVAGVAAGLGDLLGVDRVVVRLAFVVLSFAGGVGVVAYLLLWLLSSEPSRSPSYEPEEPPAGTLAARVEKTFAVGLALTGALLLLRAAGVWFGDAVVWPITLGAFGSAVIWVRAGDERRSRWSRAASRHPVETVFTRPVSKGRVALGAFLVAGGMAVFLGTHAGSAVRGVVAAATVTFVGLALIVGPGMLRLVRQLGEERRERIRSEERAEMAAHLHDSVLQSLAMIQRAASPEQMASLARAQERELRTWLYGRAGRDSANSLAATLEDAAARVEEAHHVLVDVVTVGDVQVDDRLQSIVAAASEAMANAARHARVSSISVYLEVEPDQVTVFVRDQGRGFDPSTIPPDRMGVADSIEARMQRVGGRAHVRSAEGRGTEVELQLPRVER